LSCPREHRIAFVLQLLQSVIDRHHLLLLIRLYHPSPQSCLRFFFCSHWLFWMRSDNAPLSLLESPSTSGCFLVPLPTYPMCRSGDMLDKHKALQRHVFVLACPSLGNVSVPLHISAQLLGCPVQEGLVPIFSSRVHSHVPLITCRAIIRP
jgi:hypothetical protein